MKKPVLVIMAAGMGSRFGGLKQIEPMGPNGELIIDYSLYDARRAGFESVVFVIKEELEETFRAVIGDRAAKTMDVTYVCQKLSDIPDGFSVPSGREKPWGTGHAVYSCRNVVNGPFAVINSDDYYGPTGFSLIYDALISHPDTAEKYNYAMVGYRVKNTVTQNGYVSRGVCVADNGLLRSVTERTHIETRDNGVIAFTEDGGASWTALPPDTLVSMNLWGFQPSIFAEQERAFKSLLSDLPNPLKSEFYLPNLPGELAASGKADVRILTSPDVWYGVTYRADRDYVMDAFRQMHASGVYPDACL